MRPSVDTIDMVRVVDYYNCITVIVSRDSELGEDFFFFPRAIQLGQAFVPKVLHILCDELFRQI